MPQVIQRNFTSGEIAPAVRSRADLTKYTTGLARCENFFVRAQGGVYSRPGLRYAGTVFDPDRRARLIPFSFSTEQTYALVFEHQRMSVVKDGGLVLESTQSISSVSLSNPVEVTVTGHSYTTGDVVYLSSVGGTIEIDEQLFRITVTGANTFTLDGVDGTDMTAYTSGGTVARVYSIATPYTEDQLPFLQYTQSADVMTLTHPSHDTRNLSRLADDNWSLDVVDYAPTIDPPDWHDTVAGKLDGILSISIETQAVVTFNVGHSFVVGEYVVITAGNSDPLPKYGENVHLYRAFPVLEVISGTQVRVDLDTTGATYSPGANEALATVPVVTQTLANAGGRYGPTYATGSAAKYYSYVVTAVDEDGVESIASEPRAILTGAISSTSGNMISWVPRTGADYYRVYKDAGDKSGIYGWIGDSEINSFVDFNIAPVTSDAPPVDKRPFDGADNKPSTVTYYQQRQIFANTNNDPQTLFATQTADYKSFRISRPTRDDDAIEFTLASRQVNEIRHLVPLDSLIILTSGAEFRLTEGQDQVLTPATIGVRPQSFNGASWVRPVIINSTALYVQEKGTRLRDLLYDFSSDSYTGSDLSIMSEHLLEGHEIKEMSFAQEPYGIVWMVRDDGVLLGFTYQREHQVWGWHQHSTDGEFESVATVSENGRDATYVIVKRTVNGVTQRYIERLEPRLTQTSEESFFVDAGSTYSGAAATTIYGLWHLEGKDVSVLADGNVVTGLTVTGGKITLPRAASTVHIGLAYTPVIETLDMDLTAVRESLKANRVSISQVVVEVEKSRGLWVGPLGDDNEVDTMREIKPRFDEDGYGPIALRDRKEVVNIEPEWSRGGGLRLEQRYPLPLSILSVTPDVQIGD